jgi:hypothetical protein
LKLLAKQLNTKNDGTDSWCITNAIRPLLSHGPKGVKGGARRSLLYIEAVRKFSAEIKHLDLTDVYRRALPSFAGRLERNFVVLKDDYKLPDEQTTSGANTEPIGQKQSN